MCVACIIYSRETLEHFQMMEKSNPHGAGVAWVDTTSKGERKVFFSKGLTAEDIFPVTGGWDPHLPLSRPLPVGNPRPEGPRAYPPVSLGREMPSFQTVRGRLTRC
jgi:hypothetical protein